MAAKERKAGPGLQFVFGGVSGMMATCVVQPLDLVKTRMQLSGVGGGAKAHKTSFHAVANIAKSEGIYALYKGFVFTLNPHNLPSSPPPKKLTKHKCTWNPASFCSTSTSTPHYCIAKNFSSWEYFSWLFVLQKSSLDFRPLCLDRPLTPQLVWECTVLSMTGLLQGTMEILKFPSIRYNTSSSSIDHCS